MYLDCLLTRLSVPKKYIYDVTRFLYCMKSVGSRLISMQSGCNFFLLHSGSIKKQSIQLKVFYRSF